MPADLQFWHPDHLGDAKGKLQFRHVNTLGTPIQSSSWLDNGADVADIYELTFTNSGGTVTATIECLIQGSKNPYRDVSAGRPAVADGVTVNKLLVPGVGLVIPATVATGNKARVAVWNYLEDDGSYTAYFSWGIVDSGTTSTGRKVAIKNVGDAQAGGTVLYALPGRNWTGAGGETIVAKIAPHTSPLRHKMAVAGAYTITFTNWADNGDGHKKCDIYVDGVLCVLGAVLNGDLSAPNQYGSTGYDDAADKLKGYGIVLADTMSDPTGVTITLNITSDYTWLEFAPDVSGTPGTYANQDLTITQDGQPSGVVDTGGAKSFWMQEDIPEPALAGALRKRVMRIDLRTI